MLPHQLPHLVETADHGATGGRLLLVEDEVDGIAEGAEDPAVEREAGSQGGAPRRSRAAPGREPPLGEQRATSKTIAISIVEPPPIRMFVLNVIRCRARCRGR